MVRSFKVAVADLGGNDRKILSEMPLGRRCLKQKHPGGHESQVEPKIASKNSEHNPA